MPFITITNCAASLILTWNIISYNPIDAKLNVVADILVISLLFDGPSWLKFIGVPIAIVATLFFILN